MKRRIELLAILCASSAMLVGIYVGFVDRFSHPEKIETQLFIDNWHLWAIVVLAVLCTAWIIRRDNS